MIDLRLGAPQWYAPAAAVLLFTVLVALLITPLRWPWTVAVVGFAIMVAVRVVIENRRRAHFDRLLVYPDFALAVIDRDDNPVPVETCGQSWVSSVVVVACIRLPSGSKVRLVIARSLNAEEAFRRFRVLCRFGLDAGTAGEAYTGPRSSQM